MTATAGGPVALCVRDLELSCSDSISAGGSLDLLGGKARLVTYALDARGCWVCTSHAGRPPVTLRSRQGCKAHVSIRRLMWERFFGAVPGGKVVFAACRNRRCINPDHLTVGSYTERGAFYGGIFSGNATFTAAEVDQFRRCSPEEFRALVKESGLSQSAYYARRGRTYRNHPTPPPPSRPVGALSGKELRRRRVALGLTIYDVAAALGLHYSTVSLIERGKRALYADRERPWVAFLTAAEKKREAPGSSGPG